MRLFCTKRSSTRVLRRSPPPRSSPAAAAGFGLFGRAPEWFVRHKREPSLGYPEFSLARRSPNELRYRFGNSRSTLILLLDRCCNVRQGSPRVKPRAMGGAMISKLAIAVLGCRTSRAHVVSFGAPSADASSHSGFDRGRSRRPNRGAMSLRERLQCRHRTSRMP